MPRRMFEETMGLDTEGVAKFASIDSLPKALLYAMKTIDKEPPRQPSGRANRTITAYYNYLIDIAVSTMPGEVPKDIADTELL
jgi:hypothetical protein